MSCPMCYYRWRLNQGDKMGYSRSIKVSILRRILPPNNASITKVSEEIGLNDQTIRNWIKQASGSQLLATIYSFLVN